jgi:phenylpropionate dioxygenase-like ring-hydroxylating dioxygenase large terminal subunit
MPISVRSAPMPRSKNQVPTDEQYLQALRRAWFPVARSADLESGRGLPQGATLLGVPLVVFLDHDGQPAVLNDVCPHRGSSLSAGTVQGQGVECPYHGWSWGPDGRCLRIPSLPARSPLPQSAKAQAYPALERYGLIWTCLEEPLVEPPHYTAAEAADWIYAAGEPFEVQVGPATLVENFRDVAHFAFVHRETFGQLPAEVEPLEARRNGFEVSMQRRTDLAGAPDAGWGSVKSMDYWVQAPAFVTVAMHTEHGDRFLIGAPSPVSTEECVNFWVEGFSPDYDELTLEEAVEFEGQVYAEDRRIMDSMRQREVPLDVSEQVHTLADSYTLAYRQALVEFISRATQ